MKIDIASTFASDAHFYELYDAVKDDNVDVVEKLFFTTEKMKFDILNACFDVPPLNHGPFQQDIEYCMKFNVSRMWHLAASFNSRRMMQLFLREGVNILQEDEKGNNVIHILTLASYFCPFHEELRCVAAYHFLLEQTGQDVMSTLLVSENHTGLRPLELASTLGVMHMCRAIVYTSGLYLSFVQPYGIYEIRWYDITEYEEERALFSPLIGLMALEEHKIADPVVHSFYESHLIQYWLCMKKRSLKYFLGLSLVARILFAMLFIMYMIAKCSNDLSNLDPAVAKAVCFTGTIPYWLTSTIKILLSIISIGHILIDVSEIYALYFSTTYEWLVSTPRGNKQMAVSLLYYRFVDCLMSSSTLLYLLLTTLQYNTSVDVPKTVTQLVYATALIMICWSMLNFLQLHSTIGVFVMSIQRMFGDLAHFTIIFALLSFPFVYSFTSIVYEDYAQTNVTNVSEITTNPYFSTLWKSHYTVFTIILNMVNFDQIGISHNSALYFLHTLFVMIVVILLMNMLIAKFSSSVAQVTNNKFVLLTAQTMAVIWSFERRYKSLLPARLYNQLKQCTFPHMDDHLYVRDIALRPNKKDDPAGGSTQNIKITSEVSKIEGKETNV